MHCSVVSSETLNSVQCSSVQTNTEQLVCFTQSFTMVLELLHRCACEIKMTVQRVETYRLRGSNIIMRSLCHVTKREKSDALVFSDACRKRVDHKLLNSSVCFYCKFTHTMWNKQRPFIHRKTVTFKHQTLKLKIINLPN